MPFSLTDSQKTKITSALIPLFTDTEFDNINDLNVLATEKIIPNPVPGTDSVDVTSTPPAQS